MTTHWSPGLNIACCNVWTAAIQNRGWCSAAKTSAAPETYPPKQQHLPSSGWYPATKTSVLPKTCRPKYRHPPSSGWYPATKTSALLKTYRPKHQHLPFYQLAVSSTSRPQYRMHGRKHSERSSSDLQLSRKRQHANVRPKQANARPRRASQRARGYRKAQECALRRRGHPCRRKQPSQITSKRPRILTGYGTVWLGAPHHRAQTRRHPNR